MVQNRSSADGGVSGANTSAPIDYAREFPAPIGADDCRALWLAVLSVGLRDCAGPDDPWLTTRWFSELCLFSGVDSDWVRRMMAEGRVAAKVRLGRRDYWRAEAMRDGGDDG